MINETVQRVLSSKTCKRLSRNHTKQDRLDLHKIKMRAKKYMRDMRQSEPVQHILANLSKHHPNYGNTVVQETERKNNS